MPIPHDLFSLPSFVLIPDLILFFLLTVYYRRFCVAEIAMVNLSLFISNAIQELVIDGSEMKLIGGMLVLMWAVFLRSVSSFKVSLVIFKTSLPVLHSPTLRKLALVGFESSSLRRV